MNTSKYLFKFIIYLFISVLLDFLNCRFKMFLSDLKYIMQHIYTNSPSCGLSLKRRLIQLQLSLLIDVFL